MSFGGFINADSKEFMESVRLLACFLFAWSLEYSPTFVKEAFNDSMWPMLFDHVYCHHHL